MRHLILIFSLIFIFSCTQDDPATIDDDSNPDITGLWVFNDYGGGGGGNLFGGGGGGDECDIPYSLNCN